MTQAEFDRILTIAYEKYNCDDIVVKAGLVRDMILFDRELCAKIAEETLVPDSGSETAEEIALKIRSLRT